VVLLGRAAVQLGTVTDDEGISAAKFGSGLLTVGLPSASLCKLHRVCANFLPSVTPDDLRETRIKIRKGLDGLPRHRIVTKEQVEARQRVDRTTKLVIYRASWRASWTFPDISPAVFTPQVQEFAPRTTWSLSNAFTSAFKELDPIPQFRATAKLAPCLELAAAVAN
jgi:hypothetical protein